MTPRSIVAIYRRLRQHFGFAPRWWPGSPLEITATALLVQRCDWSVAWSGVQRLQEAGLLSIPSLASLDPEAVRACIGGVSFARQKARRLVLVAGGIQAKGFGDVEGFLSRRHTASLRDDLLSFEGVGPETADCVLCFASDHHPSFIADEYARRAFRRLGLFTGELRSWSYAGVKAVVEAHVRSDLSLYDGFDFPAGVPREVALFRDFHAQVVELGRHHCLKQNPRCDSRGAEGWENYAFCDDHCAGGACSGCPLRRVCDHQPVTSSRVAR